MKAKRRLYNLSQGSSTAKPINPLQVRAVIFVLFFVLLVFLTLGSSQTFAQDSEQISISGEYTQLVKWNRLSGQTRHDTMQAISQDGFDSAETVIVASSENFPDALSATSLAGYYNSPILLTSTNSLTDKCSSEIKRLGAKKVIVVGGTSAVSDNAFSQIKEIVGENNATRLSGSTRYETSLEIYNEGKTASIWSKTAIVASGEGFADALSMSPWAYFQKSPIFLADNEGALSDDAIQAITNDGFERVVIAGGTAVVSNDTQAQLEDIVGEDNVERLAGENRYDTSQDIVDWCVSEGALKYQGLAIATGQNFLDSLSGGALCGHRGSVIMLACDDDYDGAVSSLHENRATIEYANVLGGPVSISDTLYAELQETTLIEVTPIDFSKAQVDTEGKTYTGSPTQPEVTIEGLIKETDFVVEYGENTNAGTGTVTVKGIGLYTGEHTWTFDIAPYDISSSTLSFANTGTTYTGSAIEAGTATITLDTPLAGGTETITRGTDFTISSSSTLSATNAGTYTATAEGTGNYTGTLSGTWTIAQADLPDSDIAAVKTAIGTPEVYVGTKLSNVTLPTLTSGILAWSSEYTAEETVGDAATTVERNAIYTPTDTNYKPATIAVNINVKKTYTVVYHSNGGTLEGATYNATNAEYTYSEEIDLDNKTSALTANKFTSEGKTFAYWTLGKSDTNVLVDNATTTTLTYVDGHSLADGNGMYTNTSSSSSKTKAAVGATVDLYAHWADDSIGDYWMAAAGATLPDAIDGIVMAQTQVAAEIAKSGTSGTSTALTGYMNSDSTGGNPGTGTHLYTRWNEDKALPMADRYVEFRIVQVGEHLNITDDTTSGDGSNVTFMAVHSLPTAQQANANNTNVGGWGSSDLRGLMTSYVAANIPSDFTSALKTVTKKAYSGSNGNWVSDSTTNDKIWLMSYSELTGATRKTAGFEGTQYAWFSSKVTNLDLDGTNAAIANLHKTRSGLSPESLYYERVWMRSPELSMWGRFWAVYWDGNPNWLWYPANSLSVCIAFSM